MQEKDSRIFTTSMKALSKKLEYYGDANFSRIALLKLIYKYVSYSTTYSMIQRLNTMVTQLQRVDPLICLEKQADKGYIDNAIIGVVDIVTDNTNLAPTLADSNVTVVDGVEVWTFTYNELFSGYSDTEGSPMSNFVIKSLPANGTLKYNGIVVGINTLYSDASLLTYEKDSDSAYVTSFTYSAYDSDNQLPLESNTATCTLTVEAIVLTNEAPTVGDRAQYASNRATTIFRVADFTSETIAPYFDPESNDLDAIRIDELSDANTGVYYYFGNPVVEGQVITASELGIGAFYHVAADVNSVSTDSFNASVRDDVNMTWVS